MSGVLHGVLASLKSAVTVVTDAFFKYVSLLLNTTSTNGAQNNTFLDGSTNAFSITRNGNTTQGTFSPFSQTGWSNYFDGTGDYLNLGGQSAFAFGTNDFTVEMWIYPLATGAQGLYGSTPATTDGAYLTFSLNASNNLTVYVSAATRITGSVVASVGQWTHVAVCRSGTSTKLFVNGTQDGVTWTDTTSYLNGANRPVIGTNSYTTTVQNFNGYISNARVVNGTAVYTSNFTPPTSPLTAITNTSLLTCQSNRFIDNSSNAFAITRNGDVSVQAFSPFNPTSAWSASTNGGSGYFDGAGDYLTAASNDAFRTDQGDWTIEGWLYATATGSVTFITRGNYLTNYGYYFGSSTNNTLYWESGNGAWNTTATYTSSANAIVLGQWNHVAAVRSGTTFSMYANGVRVFTQAGASFGTNVTAPIFIGTYFNVSTYINGYFTDFRFVKGTAVYTGTTYTVPTAPLTAITNTSLLLNFTNAGIYDSASGNDLETVGNAQVSTVQAKWGTTSMAFDGTGDRLTAPATPILNLASGDFTVECWVYFNNTTGDAMVCYRGAQAITAGTDYQWNIYRTGTSLIVRPYSSITDYSISVGTIAANTWYHVALTRSGSTFRGFLNGTVSATTQTIAGALNNNAAWFGITVGNATVSGVDIALNGYIDDLRITNGYARYGFFTPPTSALTATAYTGLLANTTTTNGAQNNTFLDGSTNNFSITRNGNTTQGSFSPFSNSGWSNYFDGTGDYLSVADNAALQMGSGDFTIEFWWNPASIANFQTVLDKGYTAAGGLLLQTGSGNGTIVVYAAGVAAITASSGSSVGNWDHYALVRSGTTMTLYRNGASVGSATNSTNFNSTASLFFGGSTGGGGYYVNGYLSNFRIVKGTAVYTTNFTPPTSPLTAISGTSLLTCQSNRFIDNSSNNFTITRNGDTSVQAFSPFTPATYSTSTNGGSGYFDGTGDYLIAPTNAAFDFGSGDFTVELWFYSNIANSNYQRIFGINAGGTLPTESVAFEIGSTGILMVAISGSTQYGATTATPLSANTWHHLALVRNGNTVTGYINGVSAGSSTLTGAVNFATGAFPQIGAWFTTAYSRFINGYVADLRIVKGTAVYTANFTPPTAPLTAITNTSLLLNFTNAGIFDAAGANNFETVGNAQVSTTQAKYGTTSMYFDGTGDYLTSPNWPNLNMGSANFTVECWIYFPSAITTTKTIIDKDGKSAVSWPQYALQITSASKAYAIISTTTTSAPPGSPTTSITGATTLNTNTWYHIALTRIGTNATLWVNGVADGTTSAVPATLNTRNAPLFVGYGDSAVTTTQFNGYIQDLRITNGQALYTTNFTPPTAAFPVQ